jgi:hypothetical protein
MLLGFREPLVADVLDRQELSDLDARQGLERLCICDDVRAAADGEISDHLAGHWIVNLGHTVTHTPSAA